MRICIYVYMAARWEHMTSRGQVIMLVNRYEWLTRVHDTPSHAPIGLQFRNATHLTWASTLLVPLMLKPKNMKSRSPTASDHQQMK